MILLRLFIEFFKIGLFAIGGGMATIPFLRQLSLSTGWFPPQLITDMIAISESTPGPIGINMATYVGYNIAGPCRRHSKLWRDTACHNHRNPGIKILGKIQ